MPPTPLHLSSRSRRTTEQPISWLIQQAVENRDLISLAAGLVDEETLPAAEVVQACEAILRDGPRARAALQYGTTQGLASLRQQLLERLRAADGLTPADHKLAASDVVLTTGSQQLLYLLGETLIDPGDLVIVEAPTYFVFQGTLRSLGARILSVPVDHDGLDVEVLAELLDRLERTGEIHRLRFIYVCDYFQNPTGRTLSLPRRQRLVELVERHSRRQRILIVEDAAYRELRYDGPDLPSIKSFDPENQYVVLAQTFSKPCAPGLKTGFGVLPRDLMEPVLLLKGNHDFGSSNLLQHVLDDLLASGAYDRHVARLRRAYRRKRDALTAALAEHFPASSGIRWTRPDGGLYVWLTFPEGTETGPSSALMRAALRENVLYVPGEFCYDGSSGPVPRHEARLSFGVASEEQLREGVARLARAAAAARAERSELAAIEL
ncbi:MAG: PLP-dependent aminotransferase family protein [Gemmataceae bacterium]|nr:PLP-dependent aminotransferase family protein [Gemmataceae bacterium]MDW8265727.1 PLP-dependent aminotransferase family protein [Gemmataceae bacterium]